MKNELVLSNSPARYTVGALAKQTFRPDNYKTGLHIYSELSAGKPQYMSQQTQEIEGRLQELLSPVAPSMLGSPKSSLEEKLFDATAGVKVLTSQVAMYLDSQWRSKLFTQIDFLHDIDEWEQGDEPLQRESFATFLKAICELKPKKRPGLGLTSSGQLIAAWTAGSSRLTIEFLVNSRVKWVISRQIDNEIEHYVGDTTVNRLAGGLGPHRTEEWFG
jgi:hypothetical protein